MRNKFNINKGVFMKRFLMVVLAVVMAFTVGCSGMMAMKDSVCHRIPEGETSVICEAAFALNIAPENMASILKLANTGALYADAYTAQQALKFLDEVEQFLIKAQAVGLTYVAVAEAAKHKYGELPGKVQAAFIILEDFLEVPQPIADKLLTDFDFKLLLGDLQEQRRVAMLFSN